MNREVGEGTRNRVYTIIHEVGLQEIFVHLGKYVVDKAGIAVCEDAVELLRKLSTMSTILALAVLTMLYRMALASAP